MNKEKEIKETNKTMNTTGLEQLKKEFGETVEWTKFLKDAKKRLGSQDLGDTHIYKKKDLVGGVTTTSEDAECCDCGGELYSKEEKEVEMCNDCIRLLDE